MSGREPPRRHGMRPLQALGICAGCIALLYLLTAALLGP
jgi:hypothetical protein